MPPLWVPLPAGVGAGDGNGCGILEVSSRRTTLVWLRQRFVCGRGDERHLEGHPEFEGGLTRRFVRRLVADARMMSIRAVSHHHGVGWHQNILGLVKVHSANSPGRLARYPGESPMVL